MNITARFPAFSSRNYRLFFVGQGLSLIGSWMSQTACIWLAYYLTNSPFLLGLTAFASQIPNVIFLPIAGVLTDKTDRHKVLLYTQILSMLQIATLAILTLTKMLEIWHLVAISLLSGTISAFDTPARQVFVTEIVDKKADLPNAIALNASMFNGARLIGPALAGILIAKIGAGYCFLIDTISYIAVVIALLLMEVKPFNYQAKGQKGGLENLKEGFEYVFKHNTIRPLVLLLAINSFMGFQYTVLNPIFAKGNSEILGYLMAASGIGAFLGAGYLSTRKKDVFSLTKFIAFAPIITGTALIIYSHSPFLWLSLLMMFVTGVSFIFQFVGSNTLVQTIVDDDKRGRVLSIYTLAFFGVLPFGNLYAGFSASYIGAANTLMIAGGFCILGALLLGKDLLNIKRDRHEKNQ
jgi:MFS family permease